MRKTYVFFVTNFPSLLLISAIPASSPLLVDEYRRALAHGDALILYRALRHYACGKTTLAITTNAITATFLIASPFPSQLPPASHFLRSLLALNPAVPPDHLLSIDRPIKGFVRTRTWSGSSTGIHSLSIMAPGKARPGASVVPPRVPTFYPVVFFSTEAPLRSGPSPEPKRP